MTGCPNLSFSCSNISCSIWFCCDGGGSNKEHEREQNEKPQAPAVPNNNPQASPPQPQVIVPDHLRKPTPNYVEQPPPPPPEPPPRMPLPPNYTQPPPTTQQEATRPPPTLQTSTYAAPPKVHDPWTQTVQTLPQTHPVGSQTQMAPMLPPSVPSPPNKILHDMQRPNMQMIPPRPDHLWKPAPTYAEQPVASPPPAPPPCRVLPTVTCYRPHTQPPPTLPTPPPKVHDSWTETTQISPHAHPIPVWSQSQTPSAPILPPSMPSPKLHDMQRPNMQTMPPMVNQHHPAHFHLPSETYYYDETTLSDVVPPQAALSQHFMGYPQGHWE